MRFSFLNALVGLLYPSLCAACGRSLFSWEKLVCTQCRNLLPKTGYELNSENPLAELFYGNAVTITGVTGSWTAEGLIEADTVETTKAY